MTSLRSAKPIGTRARNITMDAPGPAGSSGGNVAHDLESPPMLSVYGQELVRVASTNTESNRLAASPFRLPSPATSQDSLPASYPSDRSPPNPPRYQFPQRNASGSPVRNTEQNSVPYDAHFDARYPARYSPESPPSYRTMPVPPLDSSLINTSTTHPTATRERYTRPNRHDHIQILSREFSNESEEDEQQDPNLPRQIIIPPVEVLDSLTEALPTAVHSSFPPRCTCEAVVTPFSNTAGSGPQNVPNSTTAIYNPPMTNWPLQRPMRPLESQPFNVDSSSSSTSPTAYTPNAFMTAIPPTGQLFPPLVLSFSTIANRPPPTGTLFPPFRPSSSPTATNPGTSIGLPAPHTLCGYKALLEHTLDCHLALLTSAYQLIAYLPHLHTRSTTDHLYRLLTNHNPLNHHPDLDFSVIRLLRASHHLFRDPELVVTARRAVTECMTQYFSMIPLLREADIHAKAWRLEQEILDEQSAKLAARRQREERTRRMSIRERWGERIQRRKNSINQVMAGLHLASVEEIRKWEEEKRQQEQKEREQEERQRVRNAELEALLKKDWPKEEYLEKMEEVMEAARNGNGLRRVVNEIVEAAVKMASYGR
ncbi:hypothetical protein EX30DRAFT_255497 [Ascodesmis nigricans]|uniref:Uncharacterized protein n=1 Tax=Ascodesmis nigricans TaxID=341454 RepID=A0A4S2MHN0_9PEZI|nr:hypothetical protein EX30DRAFT_255497 [Ascodesmis nigricans]